MSLSSANNSDQSPDNRLLRFGCPACGVRLVVDQSIAGTEGPCPSCGASIVAPPLGSGRDITGSASAPLAVKPRGQKRVAVDLETSDQETSYPPTRHRSISASTAVSDRSEEKKNTLAFFKILCAVLLVALIVAGVYLYLKSNH